MSVVAVKIENGIIEVAADSIAVSGSTKIPTDDFSKIFEVNDMIIGGVGAAQENGLMHLFASTHKPYATAGELEILDFMVDFMNWKTETTGIQGLENFYIIYFNNKVFYIEPTLWVYEVKSHAAIGAGRDYALAALHLGKTATEAVKVACDLCCYVAEPIITFRKEIKE